MFYFLLGRILRPGAKLGFYIYNHLVKQSRARVIVRNEFGEVLLLRSWIGSGKWTTPGGGVEKGEDPKMAAMRELFEETGIDMPIGAFSYITTTEHAGYLQPIFEVTVKKAQLPQERYNKREITHIGWFDPEKLPQPVSSVVETML